MPKRKCECKESKEERYRRQIRRLEKKLKENKDGSEQSRARTPSSARTNPAPESPTTIQTNEENDAGDFETIDLENNTGAEPFPPEENPQNPLDESIIMALGQTVSSDKEYGPEVHPELVKRIEGIITQGLKQDAKDELFKKYLVPTNTKLLDAPKLNKELEGLLNDTMKARDKRVEERQQQVGVAIAALLSTTDKLIKDEVDKIKLISTISDVTRLLTDLHHQDTVTRKKLIIPNLDKNIGKTIETQKRDEYLFGEKFTDNVKAATAIKKSAGTILKQTKSHPIKLQNRPNQSQPQYPKKQGNYRGPPRPNVTQFKQGGGGKYHQQHYTPKPRPPQRPPVKPSVRQT